MGSCPALPRVGRLAPGVRRSRQRRVARLLAVFHAATAFFLGEGVEFGKHEAVETAIHRDLVRTGRIPRELGSSYSALRELRLVGDYGLDENVTQADARDALERAARFLSVLRALADEQTG